MYQQMQPQPRIHVGMPLCVHTSSHSSAQGQHSAAPMPLEGTGLERRTLKSSYHPPHMVSPPHARSALACKAATTPTRPPDESMARMLWRDPCWVRLGTCAQSGCGRVSGTAPTLHAPPAPASVHRFACCRLRPHALHVGAMAIGGRPLRRARAPRPIIGEVGHQQTNRA